VLCGTFILLIISGFDFKNILESENHLSKLFFKKFKNPTIANSGSLRINGFHQRAGKELTAL
jgi:hypothetical protein